MQFHHYNAIPVARVGQWIAAGAGAKQIPSVEDFDIFGEQLAVQEAKSAIAPKVARLFLELSREGKVPPWVIGLVDAQMIRRAAQ